ncbi:hypothetical protein, partial [Vibrio parahaemolyticus]|uniref:hypothetical protein n=1 Tax=Vibrio parahaemolyticus TaxID=670 RepID=UPI001BAF0E1B
FQDWYNNGMEKYLQLRATDVNYHLLKKVALCEPPKRGPLFSPAPIAAALLALASLDVLHIGVLFLH